MIKIHPVSSVSQLAGLWGAETLRELGERIAASTSGVRTSFLQLEPHQLIHYDEDHYGITRALPNIWAGHYATGIQFSCRCPCGFFEVSPVNYFPVSKYKRIESRILSMNAAMQQHYKENPDHIDLVSRKSTVRIIPGGRKPPPIESYRHRMADALATTGATVRIVAGNLVFRRDYAGVKPPPPTYRTMEFLGDREKRYRDATPEEIRLHKRFEKIKRK